MDGLQLILMILCLFGVVGWYLAGERRDAAVDDNTDRADASSYRPRRNGFIVRARKAFSPSGDARKR